MHEIETITGEPVWASPDGEFDYIPGILWVKPTIADEVVEAIGGVEGRRDYCGNVELIFPRGSEDDNGVLTVLSRLHPSDEAFAEGWVDKVWPEYSVGFFNHSSYFPARPMTPSTWSPTLPTRRVIHADAVRVGLIDLGFLAEAHWGKRPPGLPGTDLKPPEDRARLSPAIGHGEGAAAVILRYAPEALVLGLSLVDLLMADRVAIQQSSSLPAYKSSDMAKAMRVVAGQKLDVLVITSGFRVKPNARPQDLLDAIGELDGTHVVAAAGNGGEGTAYWPAADNRVIGVQASEPIAGDEWRLACYSSRAPGYVTGPGTHDVPFIAGTFTVDTGIHKCFDDLQPPTPPHVDDEMTFEGAASVSGTSFAAPAVAGVLASHMGPGNGWLAEDVRDGHLTNLVDEGFFPAQP